MFWDASPTRISTVSNVCSGATLRIVGRSPEVVGFQDHMQKHPPDHSAKIAYAVIAPIKNKKIRFSGNSQVLCESVRNRSLNWVQGIIEPNTDNQLWIFLFQNPSQELLVFYIDTTSFEIIRDLLYISLTKALR